MRLFIVLLLLLPFQIFAQKFKLEGRIIFKDSKKPVVELLSLGFYSCTTDKNGAFCFEKLRKNDLMWKKDTLNMKFRNNLAWYNIMVVVSKDIIKNRKDLLLGDIEIPYIKKEKFTQDLKPKKVLIHYPRRKNEK